MTEEHHFEFEIITSRGRMSADFTGNLGHIVGGLAGFREWCGEAADMPLTTPGVSVVMRIDGDTLVGDTVGAIVDALERKLLGEPLDRLERLVWGVGNRGEA